MNDVEFQEGARKRRRLTTPFNPVSEGYYESGEATVVRQLRPLPQLRNLTPNDFPYLTSDPCLEALWERAPSVEDAPVFSEREPSQVCFDVIRQIQERDREISDLKEKLAELQTKIRLEPFRAFMEAEV